MLDIKQPLLGIVATLLIILISMGFIALFDWPAFSGWVSYFLICIIPMEVVMGVIWNCQHPKFAANQNQPLRGVLLVLVTVVVGVIVAAVHFYTVGGAVSPPLPMVVQCLIVSVVVTFWMSIMWGGWPFTALIKNPLAAGFTLIIAVYVINYVLFRIFFNYGFLQGAPIYDAALDPGGLFDGWSATVFYVTSIGIMFLMLHFDLWPLTKSSVLMKQPVLGLVWTIIALVLGAIAFNIGTRVLGMAAPVFLITVPIPFIFGTIVTLNMLQGSLFAKLNQPVKGICSALTAAVLGTILARIYGALAPTLTGPVPSGLPSWDFEIWVASALLAVTFPFLIFFADFFQMWPLKKNK